ARRAWRRARGVRPPPSGKNNFLRPATDTMTYYIATALAIVVLVIGSILLSRQQRDSTLPVRAAQMPEDPGYAARDAELIETGPDGRPTYVLHAELIRQRPREGRIDLEKVQ